jgi:hypothetical protein
VALCTHARKNEAICVDRQSDSDLRRVPDTETVIAALTTSDSPLATTARNPNHPPSRVDRELLRLSQTLHTADILPIAEGTMDDTPVRLQDMGFKGSMGTASFWLCRERDEAPYKVFFFQDSRKRDGPSKFLAEYSGWVTVNAYGVNDGVYLGSGQRILASCCCVRMRVASLKRQKQRCEACLQSADVFSSPVRHRGSLPIDNNDIERDLRRLTISRKNWLS